MYKLESNTLVIDESLLSRKWYFNFIVDIKIIIIKSLSHKSRK